jgi:tetratricopeptide (TPR) repeat protein
MPDTRPISIYTPSNTAAEDLEAMFVQRHQLLDKTVTWCADSIGANKKNHLLFIGPRGSGKTHFITMVVNRLKKQVGLDDKMIIIWLGEDDVITSLLDLSLAIMTQLVKTDPNNFNTDCLEQARGQKPEIIAEIILHNISQQIGKRTILLVKENMNDVFKGLKDIGQKKLRAFLQEKNNIVILASSQQLFSGVSSRDEAFFGFFDTYHLNVLEIEDAKQLISNIAALNNDQPLVDFLATAQGGYRVRALHHLAGGNHRLYVELSAFLTSESLDDFVSALTKLADSLTPYFQERIHSLPAQQAKIVQKLCAMEGATPVKNIAEALFIDERSVAKQLSELTKKAYVVSHKRGKQSYYEMAEPLMRLALEVKNNQGKPLKMVASLLRTWFSDNQLRTQAEKNNKQSSSHAMAALSMDKSTLMAINSKIEKQITLGLKTQDYEKIIKASSELINGPQTSGAPLKQKAEALLYRGGAYHKKGETELALQDWTELITLPDAPVEQKAKALFNRRVAYHKKGETEFALQDWTELITLPDAPVEQKAKALFNRSVTYRNKGETELKLQDLTELITLPDTPVEPQAEALLYRSVTYDNQGETELALQDLSKLITLPDAPVELKAKALFFLPELYFHQLQIEPAQSALQAAFEQVDNSRADYPANTQDILRAINQLGSSFWQKQVTWIIALYAEYAQLDALGTALIHSISFFVEDESLASSFKKWQQLWQDQAEQHAEMQLPLQVLQAAVLAVEQKNDKPLMRLPKEVRALVLPLFKAIFN